MAFSKSKQKNLSPLQRALDFNEDDLAANRQGLLTPRQRHLIERGERREWWSGVAFGGAFGVLALVGVMFVLHAFINQPKDVSICWGIFIPIGGLMAWFGIQVANERWTMVLPRLSHLEGRVEKFSGPLHIRIFSSRNSTSYYLVIQGKDFRVSRDIVLAIRNWSIYDMYVTSDTRQLLSLECVGPEHVATRRRMLYDTFAMQPDDLPANRQGRLSEAQRQRLQQDSLGCLVVLFIPLFMCSCIGVLLLAMQQSLVVVVGGFVVSALICVGFALPTTLDARRGTVMMKEGLPLLDHRLTIKDKSFAVSLETLIAFNPDVVHRVYYTPLSNTIVAAERIEPSP